MNDLDLFYMSFKVMSTIVSHSPLNISETIRDRGFQRITNMKRPMENWMITCPMTSY